MNYSEEFKTLLNTVSDGYIGHGNPNAKILFLGQEPAWNREDEKQNKSYEREIKGNRKEWSEIVTRGDGYDVIDRYVDNFDPKKEQPDFYSPLHPWPLQKFQVRTEKREERINGHDEKIRELVVRGNDGTARSWYKYQTLIYLIFEEQLCKEEGLTLHFKSFHTDMSDAAYRQHDATNIDSKQSVSDRMDLLKHPFFQNFPVVIASVGNFPRDVYGDKYFGDVFHVDYIGNQAGDNLPWINVSVREGDNPQILIHCRQASAPLPNAYFERIAEIVCDFAKKHNINLNPTE